MSDPVLPLGGAGFDGLVRISEQGPQGALLLRGDLSSPVLKKAATALTGAELPGLRGASARDERAILWMAPDELLLLLPRAEVAAAVSDLQGRAEGLHALVTDVSDMRAHFLLQGALAREVLAKLSPADLSPESFGPGDLRRTRLGQVAAGLWMRDAETVQVFCFRSVAAYVFALLKNAAAPGSAVGYFRS
jgi:sarcosine oxidase subunit gamma